MLGAWGVEFSVSGRRSGTLAIAGAVTLLLAACAPVNSLPKGPASAVLEPQSERGSILFPPSEIPSLSNMTDVELVAKLGPPDFTRVDEPARLWQYRGATCVLDVFLYPDGASLKVVHASSRARRIESASTTSPPCSPFMPQTASVQ